MSIFQLDPRVKHEALLLKTKIHQDNVVDIEFGYSEYKCDALFVIRAEFRYRLQIVRDEFFEGDGLIVMMFNKKNDLRPVYIMVSHKTLI